ncbi:MAG TPA: O-succinylhomoserine sulfhydrylase [Stellaceae bacterium]|jgi:O-succinylhomoserine sulfhydrylase|nr:O-succinylhomoserine sulfhydrylase [Stellaceae bacterium]
MSGPASLPENSHLSTLLVHGGGLRSQHLETSEAIYMTSGYVYGSAEEAESAFANDGSRFVYSRYANPTVSMFEERLRLIEGAEVCRATGSGMAAVFAALASVLKHGDRLVASRALFGSCLHIVKQILPRYGVETEVVDGRDLDAWRRALSRPTKLVFCETPSNPTLELVDLEAVAKLTHAAGGLLVVDNVFATPLLQRPLKLGADVVVYSATKHIDGQGRSLGGAVLGSRQFVTDHLAPFLRHTGPSISPFNAWLLLKGLETLPLRVQQHCRNAAEVAAFLEKHPKVVRALYPGLESHPQHQLARRQMTGSGNLVAFVTAGAKAGAFRFQNALRIVKISNNLGDAKSLITHPATTTHQKLSPEDKAILGIDEALVRLSVGLEDAADLIEDLDRALAAV